MAKVHMELVPSGIVEVTPLRTDDKPLGARLDVPGVGGSGTDHPRCM